MWKIFQEKNGQSQSQHEHFFIPNERQLYFACNSHFAVHSTQDTDNCTLNISQDKLHMALWTLHTAYCIMNICASRCGGGMCKFLFPFPYILAYSLQNGYL